MAKPHVCIVCIAVVLLAAGCDRAAAPPAQQAAQALAAAREDMEKARTSIQATEQQSKTLQERIQAQRTELDALVERRLTLLRQQLAEDEARISRLPAPREIELRPRLGELQKQFDDVKARLQAYRDAPPENSQAALAALEQSFASLTERRRELEAQLKSS